MANCGCNDELLNCNQDCTSHDCSCAKQIDTECIFYNLCDQEASKLTCINKPNGTNLKDILEALDDKICSAVTYNFSTYNLSCLRDKYTITNMRQFSEAVATEICLHTSQINSLTNLINTVNNTLTTSIKNLNTPELTDKCDLGLLLTDDLKTTLQKIVDKLCSLPVQSDVSPRIKATNSPSIQFITSGTKDHSISAQVAVSPDTGNILKVLTNGLFVPTPDGQTPQVLSFDEATRTIYLSGNGGYVVIPPDLDNQTLSINIPNKTISISNGNTIDLTPLFSSIVIAETPITPIDSNSIDLTVSGTANHTLRADVRINNTVSNALTVGSNGLYVKPEETIIANDTSTIGFSLSGAFNHTISADVKVDMSQPNAIVVNAGGLFVQPFTNTLSANNGLYLDGTVLKLGGTALIENTTITTTNYNFLITKEGNINNAAQRGMWATFSLTNGTPTSTETSQYPYAGIQGGIGFFKSNNTTLVSTTLVGGVLGLNFFNQSGNVSGAFVGAITGTTNFGSTGNLVQAASFVASAPQQDGSSSSYSGTVTDYAGIYIQDITNVSTVALRITNKWGIYQEGTSDKNYFGGSSRFVKGFQIESKAGDPSGSDIPSGNWGVWKNTSSGAIKVWANNGGTYISATLS